MALVKSEDTGRDVWLEVALQVLLDAGVDAISISGLARDLGVTRGAFYWHFETRDALLSALLPVVVRNAMPPVFDELILLDSDSGFLALLDSTFLPDAASMRAHCCRVRLEHWADIDRQAQSALLHLGTARKYALRQFLLRAGHPVSKARISAEVMDRLITPSTEPSPDRGGYATDLAHLFEFLTGTPLSPARLSRHLNRTLPARS